MGIFDTIKEAGKGALDVYKGVALGKPVFFGDKLFEFMKSKGYAQPWPRRITKASNQEAYFEKNKRKILVTIYKIMKGGRLIAFKTPQTVDNKCNVTFYVYEKGARALLPPVEQDFEFEVNLDEYIDDNFHVKSKEKLDKLFEGFYDKIKKFE